MESIALWQGLTLCGIVSWIFISSCLNVTQKLRNLVQPWVSHHVITGTPIILQIQKYQHGFLDALFSGLSCVVSVPFYTAFLPLLFWSGHGKLARQMTLLMAFCDYSGNCIKDVVSAPRPSCPPVKRMTATKDEEENALEYGLPSSHTLNTICLSGYLLHYVLSYTQNQDASLKFAGFSIFCLIVCLTGLGRIYLGMHSVIDIIAGLAIGFAILAFWLSVHDYVDSFIVSGQNVMTFWVVLSFLLLFAYPTPELPTPSFEFHAAFTGVAFGIVAGVQQTYHQFHHEAVPHIFTPQLTIPAFFGRVLVGLPTILVVKYCSKALAKWILPVVSNTLGIPIKSTSYIPKLNGSVTGKKSEKNKPTGYAMKLFFFSSQDTFDVDTGIWSKTCSNENVTYLGRFGPLKDVYLPRDYYTGEPRGFGFVQYLEPADAADAKHHMDGEILFGRELTVVFAEENRKKPAEMRARDRVRGGWYNDPRRSPSPRYGRSYSRSPVYYSPSSRRRHYSRPVSPRDRRYRDQSYSRSPYGSRSYSRSPIRNRSRSLEYSR